MQRSALLAAVLTCLAGAASADDPTHTDGGKYKVLLENETVRVLEYRDLPGERTALHRHPRFVVYAVQPFKRRLTLQDGRVMTREFKAGDVLFSNGESHVGENTGSTPTHVIMVELKSGGQ